MNHQQRAGQHPHLYTEKTDVTKGHRLLQASHMMSNSLQIPWSQRQARLPVTFSQKYIPSALQLAKSSGAAQAAPPLKAFLHSFRPWNYWAHNHDCVLTVLMTIYYLMNV